jgi:hypothetical protein
LLARAQAVGALLDTSLLQKWRSDPRASCFCGENNPANLGHHHLGSQAQGGSEKEIITLCRECFGKAPGTNSPTPPPPPNHNDDNAG